MDECESLGDGPAATHRAVYAAASTVPKRARAAAAAAAGPDGPAAAYRAAYRDASPDTRAAADEGTGVACDASPDSRARAWATAVARDAPAAPAHPPAYVPAAGTAAARLAAARTAAPAPTPAPAPAPAPAPTVVITLACYASRLMFELIACDEAGGHWEHAINRLLFLPLLLQLLLLLLLLLLLDLQGFIGIKHSTDFESTNMSTPLYKHSISR